jgi:hypothetical protein
MRNANTQTMPKILVINDWMPPLQESTESLIHWDFPEEDEPFGKLSLDTGGFFYQPTDEQEWRDDYYASIRL